VLKSVVNNVVESVAVEKIVVDSIVENVVGIVVEAVENTVVDKVVDTMSVVFITFGIFAISILNCSERTVGILTTAKSKMKITPIKCLLIPFLGL